LLAINNSSVRRGKYSSHCDYF